MHGLNLKDSTRRLRRDMTVVPLCKYCNKRTDEFTVKGELVPINLNVNSILK